MQEDFHFYAIYALSRSAGFSSNHSYIIAYSSQYTDDAKYKDTLKFQNGGEFSPTLTAHQYLTLDLKEVKEALDEKTCHEIWIPFHFLPGNKGRNDHSRMVTQPDSEVAQKLIDHFLSSEVNSFFLHRLGILLHVYADSWSHQNFLGLVHNKNDVRDLKIIEGEDLLPHILELVAPKIGHVQAGKLPDEPFRIWQYKNYRNKIVGPIHNQRRARAAALKCFDLLAKILNKFSEFKQNPELNRKKVDAQLTELFSNKNDINGRIEKWKKAISDGKFGFHPESLDLELYYNDLIWLGKAVKVIKDEKTVELYEKKPNFETSDWKYFNDAAKFHKEILLNEIFPKFEKINNIMKN